MASDSDSGSMVCPTTTRAIATNRTLSQYGSRPARRGAGLAPETLVSGATAGDEDLVHQPGAGPTVLQGQELLPERAVGLGVPAPDAVQVDQLADDLVPRRQQRSRRGGGEVEQP